jgi:hypothetical protein
MSPGVSTAREGVERVWRLFGKSGTLLGPEGSARKSWFPWTAFSYEPPGSAREGESGRRGVFVRDRSYFENFTVDASIFVVTTSY